MIRSGQCVLVLKVGILMGDLIDLSDPPQAAGVAWIQFDMYFLTNKPASY